MLIFLALLFLAAPADPVADILAQHGWGAPARVPELDLVAEELALALASPQAPTPASAESHLQRLLAAHSVADAQIYPFTLRHQDAQALCAGLPRLLGSLERHLPPTHMGQATVHGDGEDTTAVILIHRGLELDAPLPQEVSPGQGFAVTGRLRRGYFAPRLYLESPSGQVEERPLIAPERRVSLEVNFRGPGIYALEVVADSQYGPTVLLAHRFYVGVPPSKLLVVHLKPPASAQPPARELAALIARYRQDDGQHRLVWHPQLAAVAEQHAAEMARRGRLYHGSPDTGRLLNRVQNQGLKPRLVAENLAWARSPDEALSAFVQSPGHRQNLLLPQVTHIGVGVSGRFFAVALAELPPPSTRQASAAH